MPMAGKVDTKVAVEIKGEDKLSPVLDKAGNKAKEMGDKASAAGNKAKGGMDKAKSGAESLATKMGVVNLQIQGFTSQIAGMGAMVLDFRTKLITLDKTIVGLQSQELALTRMQEDLNAAVEEGTISQRDYQRALQDIQLQYKNVILESENVRAEQNKLTGEYVSFGIQVVSMSAQVGIAMVAMGATSTGATAAIVGGITAIRAAMTSILTHPVFLVVTAALVIWETNLLGVRNAFEKAFGIETLSIIENVTKAFDNMTKSAMPELNEEAIKVTNNMKEWDETAFKAANSTDKLGNSADKASKSFGRLSLEMEKSIRLSGNGPSFRAGSGTTLADSINRQADELNRANARTLAAASLHEALKQGGFTGSETSRNISGQLNPGGIGLSPIKGGPLGGLGNLAIQMFNQGASAEIIAKSLAKGSSGSGVSLGGGFTGLTRSGSLASGIGAGQGSRRSGRDRNPLGRNDKPSVQRMKSIFNLLENNPQLANDARFAEVAFLGSQGRNNFQVGRFGNNSGLSSSQMRAITRNRFNEWLSNKVDEVRERIGKFNTVTRGATRQEGLILLELGFNTSKHDIFRGVSQEFTNQVQTVIKARNFFNKKTNVDFDGMNKSGVAGLLNIKEFGYREMNEQLAFQGEEQFMTVGT